MRRWTEYKKKTDTYCRAVADFLFPRCCIICGRELLLYEKHLCTECLAEMPLTYFWTFPENPAEIIFWGRSYIHRVYSLFYYTTGYKKLVHAVKYKANIQLGLFLGQMLGERISETFDCIVPVPLHYRKKWKRGFNQSQIIARGIAAGLGSSHPGCKSKNNIPPVKSNILRRKHFTKTQTRKDRIHRWKNVENAFALNKPLKHSREREIHILLVDDVLTTGATLEACSHLLSTLPGCKISIATLSYVE